MKNSSYLMALLTVCALLSAWKKANTGEDGDLIWRQLFNGKDLSGWTIKIAKHGMGENFANTFRVEDGLLSVRYDGYRDFDQQYGHVFFGEPFSQYILSLEYRFVGNQAEGGEGWALRNSGVMLHCQDPKTILQDQDFPISIEGQFLGGDGTNPRTSSNLCTPGTNVILNGELFTPHCVGSKSKTYHGDQWVKAQFIVLGDSIIHHVLDGESVITYFSPQMGGGNVANFDPEIMVVGKGLNSGYIALQSESHPIDFRKVELYDLSPFAESRQELDAILEKLGFGNFVSNEKLPGSQVP